MESAKIITEVTHASPCAAQLVSSTNPGVADDGSAPASSPSQPGHATPPHSAARRTALSSSASLDSDTDAATPTALVQHNLQALRQARLALTCEGKDMHDGASDPDSEGCCDAAHSEEDSGDVEGCNAMGNGCGEAVSPPSSCADAFLLGPSLAATAKPAEWSLHAFAPAAFQTEMTLEVPQDTPRATPAAVKEGAKPSHKAKAPPPSFAAQAMAAIAQHAAREGGATVAQEALAAATAQACGSPGSASLRLAVSGDDPIGVRQLYGHPHSLGGSVGGPAAPLHRRGSATAALPVVTLAAADASTGAPDTAGGAGQSGDVFSMERFATFYEAALEELVAECERRVATAPTSWREGQRRFLRGDSNHDLATSTLSFDSPRSSGMSPVSGPGGGGAWGPPPAFSALSGAACSPSSRAYPPCFPSGALHTHGLHSRDAGLSRLPPPPPPSASSLPRTAFFSAAGPARPTELERGGAAAEETVPALLAALGRHHGKMAPMVFIAALAYLARVTVQCASEFLSITCANWYRLTTTAILVAAKVYDEHSSTRLNAHFSCSSGIPLHEMAKLELDFLYLIDFDLLLKESEVERWLTWMETLAVRRDLMTPLQSYFVHSAEAHPDTHEKSRGSTTTIATTTAGVSRTTAGLSSEGVEAAAGSGGSPVAAPASRAFTHVRVSSNTVIFAKDAPTDAPANVPPPPSALYRTPGAGGGHGGAPWSFPVYDALSSAPMSPTSSLVVPQSLLEQPRSTLSGASLPGSAVAAGVSHRSLGAPPSPIHGVLPSCPPPQQTRLFSVVHGKREPPSPPSVRHLSRLGASPPSPLQPPSLEPHSPAAFFKPSQHSRGSVHHATGQRHAPAAALAAGATAAPRHGLVGGEGPCAHRQPMLSPLVPSSGGGVGGHSAPHHTDPARTASGLQRTDARTSASTNAAAAVARGAEARGVLPTASATTAAASSSAPSGAPAAARWGPFGMVQQVRDVLGVTASLVRGQLNVLAPAKATEGASRSQSRPSAAPAAAASYDMGSAQRERSSGGAAKPLLRAADTAEPQQQRGGSAAQTASSGRRSAPPAGAAGRTPLASSSSSSPGPHQRSRHQQHHLYNSSGGGSPLSPGRAQRSPGTRRGPVVSPHRAGHASDPSTAAAAEAYYDAHGEEEEEGYEEEGEYYDEDEYGYYGEDGYYYAYDDNDGGAGYEEGEEGEYYYYQEGEEGEDGEEWYGEEEAEEETAYFQRCRPPLTHSPPSL